jgi:hypothetical protein
MFHVSESVELLLVFLMILIAQAALYFIGRWMDRP